jgi:signal transduction histidine kinase
VNVAAAVSLCAIVGTLIAAAVGVRMKLAAGWGRATAFGWAALTASLYAVANLPSTAGPWVPDDVVLLATRLQLAFAALHAASWLRYGEFGASPARRTPASRLEGALFAAALLFALPRITLTGAVSLHEVAWMGARYRVAPLTPVGAALVVLLVVAFAALALRHVSAWCRGVRGAGPMALAFSVFLALAANDAAVDLGLLATPYLVELGLLVPLGVAAWGFGTRFLAENRELVTLRRGLEVLVEERTAELKALHEKLRRSERLATLGQVAAGVAHEVNNPSAVIAGNLEHVLAGLAAGRIPGDARECLEDSVQAVRHISRIVRQLLDAGRVAGQAAHACPVPVAPIVAEAARAARVAGGHVQLEADVPAQLQVAGEEGVLYQVLLNLLVNAVQAIPGERSDGRVTVTAAPHGGRVRIEVRDNGTGMPEDVLRRAFDPFFSTKAPGRGTGLGLAISRGLVASAGGDLRLESTPGQGTRAVIELPTPVPLAPGALEALQPAAEPPRASA